MLVLDRVMLIVAHHHEMSVSDLSPRTRFMEDLDESLDFVEVIMECEEAFRIVIPDEEAEKFITVGQLASYIENRLQEDEAVWPPAPRAAVHDEGG